MPELPKPKRVSLYNARKYIQEVCGLDTWGEVNPSFYDALCNDEVYFEGTLHIPEGYHRPAIKRVERVPSEFWKEWGYEAFTPGGAFDQSVISLPNQDRYNPPFYSNLSIATAVIDEWLNVSQDSKVRVCAVPDTVYKKRVSDAGSINTIYSRGEDREWAKANAYSVDSVEEARRKLAPKEWTGKGRRSAKKKEIAEETAE